MIRTFICIELPEDARVILNEVESRLSSRGARISWQPPSKLHITLVFLGNVHDEKISQIVEAARAVASMTPRFSLAIDGLGAFPSFTRPRTLWAGVSGNRQSLAVLAAQLEAAFAPLGFEPSGKEFRPHLTIGRIKDDRDPAVADVGRAASQMTVRLAAFDVREIIVMRSDLELRGARYTPLARLALAKLVSGSAGGS